MKKTNLDLVKVLDQMDKETTVYVMGCFGAPMRDDLKQRYIDADEYNRRPDRLQRIRQAPANWYGFDCVGMIKAAIWGWCGDPDDIYGGADYLTDICPDVGSDTMIRMCLDISDNFDTIEVGEAVWIPGHIGVYVGDGMVIECTPAWEDGVQYTVCNNISKKAGNGRFWRSHGKLPWIKYVKNEPAPAPDPEETPEKAPEGPETYSTIEDVLPSIRSLIAEYIAHGSLRGTGTDKGLNLSPEGARILAIVLREIKYQLMGGE